MFGMVPTHRLQHQIDVADLGGKIARGVVDDLVGAERADEIEFCRAGGGDDIGAARLGDLHRQVADAAGRRMDQHALARLQAAMADKALPGGQSGQRQCGADCGRCLRLRRDFIGRRRGEFRIGRGLLGEARHAEHCVADLEATVTPAPSASTVPEISQPRVKGGSPSYG